MKYQPKRGDYAVRRHVRSCFSLKDGPYTYDTYEIVRIVRTRQDGVVSHVERPYLFDGAKANGGTTIPFGSSVMTLGEYARRTELEDLDGTEYRTADEVRKAIQEVCA